MSGPAPWESRRYVSHMMQPPLYIGGDVNVGRLGLCVGGLLREPLGAGFNSEEQHSIIHRAVDLGVRLIHLSDLRDDNERTACAAAMIHGALHPYPPKVAFSTSVGIVAGSAGLPRAAVGAELRGLVEEILEQLRLDVLDLVYLQIDNGGVQYHQSIAVCFDVLAELREERLIRHLGLANCGTRHVLEALAIAPVAAVQSVFHVGGADTNTLLTTCEDKGIAFVPILSGNEIKALIHSERFLGIAQRHGKSCEQIASAWLLALSPVILLVPTVKSTTALNHHIAARDVLLTDKDLAELAGATSRSSLTTIIGRTDRARQI